ncbi:glyoxalase [Nocardia nova]|uniref:Glyoxalase n=1 Tax=Nocardia nova TaxID=37330 RepID=A0A2S6AXS4_9NOCA|nr:VOC family protein [Nocardia nova]PPJ34143.1 glyoxalase [Nocardia nova]PPJ40047.1 glyoxalase [Nocardia nova]
MSPVEFRISRIVVPALDVEASLAFYRDVLGFEVRGTEGEGATRRLTVGPVGQPELSVVLSPLTAAGRPCCSEQIDDGAFPSICLSTPNLLDTFAHLEAGTAIVEVIQEPIRHESGEYDCAFFDPAGNVVRLVEDHGKRPDTA